MEMLRQHFQKEIPGIDPLPEDDSGVDVALVFRLFRDAVRDLSGWEVKEEVWIAQFSFTKYLLWKDLADRLEALTQNRVVNHLVNEAGTPYTNPSVDVIPEQLDANYHPSDIFCPRSADSSQLAAVMAAAAGHDFVLEGPPGTGKSQTITNIISHCLAHGRKVLFVAEKRAALDVVYRRLKEEGLEPFCLELHSNKSGKAEVVGQLDRSLKFAVSKTGSDWKNRTNQLGALRDTLNCYAFDLHNRYPCELSAYHCIDYLLPRKQEQTVSLNIGSGITNLPFEQLERSRNVSKLLQQRSRPLGDLSDHSLSLVAHENWSPNWADRVTEKLRNLERLNGVAQEATNEFHKWIQAPKCFNSFNDLRNQCSLVETLLKSEPVGPEFFTTNWAQLLADLENWISCLREREGLRQSLVSIQKASESNPVRVCCEDWSASKTEQIINVASNLQSLTSKAAAATKALQVLLGFKCEKTSRLCIVNFIAFVDSLLASAPVGDQFPLHRWHEWSDTLDQWITYIQERIDLRNRLRDYDEKLLLALDLELISSKWESAQTSWFLPKWLKIEFVRKNFKIARKDKTTPPAESLGALVKDSLRLRLINGNLASAKIKAGQMLGPIWANGEPQLEHLNVVKTWGITFHERLEALSANSAEWEQHLRGFCAELFKQGTTFTEPSASTGEILHNYRDAITEYDAAYESFIESAGLIRESLDKADDHLESMAQTLSIFSQCVPRSRIITFNLDHTSLLAKACLGTLWKNGEGNPDAIEKAKTWGNALNDSLLQIAGEQITWLGQFKQLLSSVFKENAMLLSPTSVIGFKLVKFKTDFEELVISYEDLVQFASIRREQVEKDSEFHLAISLLVQKLPIGWGMIREWCSWQKVRSEALQIGFDTIVSKLESKDGFSLNVPSLFERSFRKTLLFSIVEQSSALREFFGSEQNENIEQFRNIDTIVSDLTREIIQARLSNQIPQENLVHDVPKAEIGLLRREAGKKMRHIPVRQLLSRIPTLLPRLKPCVLMSPLSVAQYLEPSHATFDVVIFDEASQIPVWDAVGAIARGKQLIVVGDPKQLPPTNFFNSSDADDDSLASEEFKDLESILDELITNGLRHKRLKWHYRSRHESLITFSNRQYYDNELLTFPSCDTTNGGVKLRYLSDAKYDKGKSRTNKAEAEALVKELVMRLKDSNGPRRSYGVVTFSLAQQQLVENLLDEERRKSPEIEIHFSDHSPVEGEPVFVKNLENVQGDERDVILFSICYGPDESGRVSMNFGPLNRDGGERRLNVAITRAKHEVIVYTGLRADQIDLTRTRAKGVQDLKYFLDYANRGPNALNQATSASADGEADSEFERMVAKKLQAAGYVIHHQVGCSGYRIDLGVVNPHHPGKYLLGIECDGATYHRAATARDRDKLRHSILEGLGWRLYRIWSTDWWHDSDKEMAKLISALETATADQAEKE
ncbi:MAG TPA: AAA domain-containing protein [Verrucomicrobiae bacterium]